MKKTHLVFYLLFIILFLNGVFSNAQIRFVNRIADQEDGIFGLTATEGIAISPDRKHIYVSAGYSLSVFAYDTLSGTVSFVTSYRGGENGFNGFYFALSVIVSPDGKNVYVSSGDKDCITVCGRDTITGLLTLQQILYDGLYGNDGLGGAHTLDISADGRFLYVTSFIEKKISTYARDTLSGNLSWLQTIAPGFTWPETVVLSKDERFLYVSSNMDDAIFIFHRDIYTGLLTYFQKAENGLGGIQGLLSVNYLKVSSDNKFLLAGNGNSISTFIIDTADGHLIYVSSVIDNSGGIDGLGGLNSFCLSPDDRFVYGIARADSCISAFSRDTLTGQLSYIDRMHVLNYYIAGPNSTTCLICDRNKVMGTSYSEGAVHILNRNPITGLLTADSSFRSGAGATITGLSSANNAAISPDDRHIYVSTRYYGVSIFDRLDSLGKLTFYKNITEGGAIQGMTGAKSIAVAKNNKMVYVPSTMDNALVLFERDSASGDLIFQETFYANQYGIVGLRGAASISSTTDSGYIYIAASTDDGIVSFKVDSTDGSLTFHAFAGMDSLVGTDLSVNMAKITPQGDYLICTSIGSNGLCLFKRDTISGLLSYLNRYININMGHGTLYDIRSFDISPDGKNVYVAFGNSDCIISFLLNPDLDSMLIIQDLDADIDQMEAIRNPSVVGASPDGRFVYVCSLDSSTVSMFQRVPPSGELAFVKTFREGENGNDGFDGISSINFSSDYKNIYFTSIVEASISSYRLLPFLGNDIESCAGDTIYLCPGKGFEAYLWSTGETTQSIMVTSPGVYSVTATNEFGSQEADSIEISFHALPVFSLGSDTTVCSSANLTLSSTAVFNEYLWNTGSSLPNIPILHSGSYSLTITDSNNCHSSDTINIFYFPSPGLDLGPDTLIHSGDTIVIGDSCCVNYEWNTGSTTPTEMIIASYFATHVLEVWVTVIDSFNCQYSDTIIIYIDTVLQVESLSINTNNNIYPNPFTDKITVKCSAVFTSIKIYNIQGNCIFKFTGSAQEMELNTGYLSPGMYFLELEVEGIPYRYRIIKAE